MHFQTEDVQERIVLAQIGNLRRGSIATTTQRVRTAPPARGPHAADGRGSNGAAQGVVASAADAAVAVAKQSSLLDESELRSRHQELVT